MLWQETNRTALLLGSKRELVQENAFSGQSLRRQFLPPPGIKAVASLVTDRSAQICGFSVPPGSYKAVVEATGIKQVRRSGIGLQCDLYSASTSFRRC
jgi:hypothetical protein